MALLAEFGANFIYDAKQKKAVLAGTTDDGKELVIELVRRNDDDSHDAVLIVAGNETARFVLREDDVAYLPDGIQLEQPAIRMIVDRVAKAKFRGFTQGNIPTPDVPADSLP
jgi:hypothetical protein